MRKYLIAPSFIIFVVIFIVMIINIIAREIIGTALDWAIEMCRYLLVWLTFIGAAYLYFTDEHIKVDFFSSKFEKSFPITLSIIHFIVSSIFGFFLVWYGYSLSLKLEFFSSPSLNISQYYLYISVPILGGVIICVACFKIFKALRS